jgi:RND family efflux transporter MFP subunit
MRFRRRLASLTVLIAVLTLAACSKEEPAAPPPPRMVRVVKVDLKALELGGSASGVIESRYSTPVGFLVGGRLINRKVDIGSLVTKGDVLAQLDAADYQNKLTAAESQVSAAQSDLARAAPQEQRYRTLLKQGYATQANYDQALASLNAAKAKLQEAQANLQLAKDQVGYTTLKADTDGAITAVGADPGQVVTAGQMIVTISQLTAREGVFSVAEQVAAEIPIGLAVHVALQSDPTIGVNGVVREISPRADPVTGTYTIKVSLPDAPDAMRLGAVVIGTVEAKGDVVATIPSGALFDTNGQPTVWVVSPTELVVNRRPVTVNRFDTETVTVSKGLNNGDLVVTAGVNSLAEGQKVRLPPELSK